MKELYSIPAKKNISIIVICSVLYFSLLYTSSLTHLLIYKFLLGIVFGIVMIPVYSLMHESVHYTLHPNSFWNLFLGRWLCTIFIFSYSFYRHCHFKHHKKNRTDEEMWDLYYEHQNKWFRFGNLYLMMIGLGYLGVMLSVVLFAIAPQLVNSTLFKKHTEIKGFVEGFDDVLKLKTSQIESICIIIFQVLCLWFINWDFSTWIIFYLINGFIWSSQNYVNHAFSPRDIINGAHNLKVPVWLNLVYLNFNLHLAHHQNPKIPWLHLPQYIKNSDGRITFLRNYLSLWKGPQLTKEPSPKEHHS
ncbi:fatty acid desaturase family protein [Flavobacterium sp. ZS1P14]|uniref:fatty acid desaturase family protein n=1 Tax=Flavobacterium sp. ZS1P14 TaxID=3401729 RepID=UPI003AAFA699